MPTNQNDNGAISVETNFLQELVPENTNVAQNYSSSSLSTDLHEHYERWVQELQNRNKKPEDFVSAYHKLFITNTN